MFLDVVSTHTKYIMNDFALAPRTDILNFKCHTVTNGTDLRKSPPKRYNIINTTKGNTHNTCNKQTNNEKKYDNFHTFSTTSSIFLSVFLRHKGKSVSPSV